MYEKRKAGALQIEAYRICFYPLGSTSRSNSRFIREIHTQPERVTAMIEVLRDDFVMSSIPNVKSGGMIALVLQLSHTIGTQNLTKAAIAIALASKVSPHLREIVPPILKGLHDHDPKVRYFACESLYNITKVSRS